MVSDMAILGVLVRNVIDRSGSKKDMGEILSRLQDGEVVVTFRHDGRVAFTGQRHHTQHQAYKILFY